jgi:hypothetical protein
VLQHPGCDSATSSVRIRPHAFEFLVFRVECRERAGRHNLFANKADPQAHTWHPQLSQIQGVLALHGRGGREVVEVGSQKRLKAGLGEVGTLDGQAHGDILSGPCYRSMSPARDGRHLRTRSIGATGRSWAGGRSGSWRTPQDAPGDEPCYQDTGEL